MKRGYLVFLFAFTTFVLLISPVLAGDVAYIYKNSRKVNQNIIDVFTELGLDTDLISVKSLPADLSSYKLLYIGDERFSRKYQIPIDQHPSIIANKYSLRDFGLTNRGGGSKIAASQPLRVNKNSELIYVYRKAKDIRNSRLRGNLFYYHISNRNQAVEMIKVASTLPGKSSHKKGTVVAHIESGTTLNNEKTAEENICFYGIVLTKYWTQEAKDLFKECVGFVTSDSQSPPDTDPEPEPPLNDSIHDVALVDFADAINNIRIETSNGTRISNESIECNQSYKIQIKAKNNGDFTENLTYSGSVNSLDFNHVSTSDLEPGESTSIKTRTVSLDIPEGDYTITVEAHISSPDATPENNVAKRDVTVTCDP